MALEIRSTYCVVEQKWIEAGIRAELPLRKVAAVAVITNPYANRYVADLSDLIRESEQLGHELARTAVSALAPYQAQSYGKAAIVGMWGEQEHANALITTVFAEPLREAVGGGKAWIPSFTKRATPGVAIDVPLASKDALYVRSHYDGMTLAIPESPQADEIAVIICVANRGRLNARVGGLKHDEIKGQDGLR
ncbi:MAG TPA: amino acid synthesis family protein [Burkholderiales bacterium]|nr:amino acid synthesis family protein [Burkholderiales bacterium]